MATAITADIMLAALKKWGITPKFYKPDWRTHNRNAVQGWGPINGFVLHNFASDISDSSSLAYLYNGDSARQLPGPLSQFAITDDGAVWVIGWGTANHCGTMDTALHNLVLKDQAPLTSEYRPKTNQSSTSGVTKTINPHYIGCEMTYGNKGPTTAQRATAVRLVAAMMDMLGTGYTGGSVVGHRECTTNRSDPQFIEFPQFRKDVNALLKAGPTPPKPSVPVAPTPPIAPPVTPPAKVKPVPVVTLSTNPGMVGYAVLVKAVTTPAVAGSLQFEWYDATSTSFLAFKTVDTTNGTAQFDWRFGGSHAIRVKFTPKDTTKYDANYSENYPVVNYTVKDLENRLDVLEAKVKALEGK